MRAEFDFKPQRKMNKTLIFDTTKINEEILIDKIIEALGNKTNDEFYIGHPVGSNYFTLKQENRRYKITTKSKKINFLV